MYATNCASGLTEPQSAPSGCPGCTVGIPLMCRRSPATPAQPINKPDRIEPSIASTDCSWGGAAQAGVFAGMPCQVAWRCRSATRNLMGAGPMTRQAKLTGAGTGGSAVIGNTPIRTFLFGRMRCPVTWTTDRTRQKCRVVVRVCRSTESE